MSKIIIVKKLFLAFGLIFVLGLLNLPFTVLAQDKSCDLDKIVEKVGKFTATDNPKVFLIQEQHNLVDGQLESAIMIHRLLRDCGIRVIGLEGAFPNTDFETPWFQKMTPSSTFSLVPISLLSEGEISQVEFAALMYPKMYPDLKITGIEDEKLYNTEIPTGDSGGIETAMIYTALVQLNSQNQQKAFDMLNAAPDASTSPEKHEAWLKEFTEFVFTKSTRQDIQDWYKATQPKPDQCGVISIEESIKNSQTATDIVTELRADTEAALGLDLGPNLEDAKADLKFYEVARDRSVVMVNEIESLFEDASQSMVVAVIGAAHTEGMVKTFKADGFGTAVLSSNSLCDQTTNVSLSGTAYNQKYESKSVDLPKLLGALLSGTKKPPVIFQEPWAKVKITLYPIAALATEAFRKNPNATLKEIFQDVPLLDGIEIDMNSLEVVDHKPQRYVFTVNINIAGVKVKKISIAILPDLSETQNFSQDRIELLLLNELDRVKKVGLKKEADEQKPKTMPVDVAPNVKAIFGENKDAVVKLAGKV